MIWLIFCSFLMTVKKKSQNLQKPKIENLQKLKPSLLKLGVFDICRYISVHFTGVDSALFDFNAQLLYWLHKKTAAHFRSWESWFVLELLPSKPSIAKRAVHNFTKVLRKVRCLGWADLVPKKKKKTAKPKKDVHFEKHVELENGVFLSPNFRHTRSIQERSSRNLLLLFRFSLILKVVC